MPISRTAPEQHPQRSWSCVTALRLAPTRTGPAGPPQLPKHQLQLLAMPCKPYNMRAIRARAHPETRWRHTSYIAFGARPALARARSASLFCNSSIIHSYMATSTRQRLAGMLIGRGLIQGAPTVGPTRSSCTPRTLCGAARGILANPVQRPVASRTRYAYTFRSIQPLRKRRTER